MLPLTNALPLLFLLTAFVAPPLVGADGVIEKLNRFRSSALKEDGFGEERTAFLNMPQWQELVWKELERLTKEAEITKEFAESYRARQGAMLEQLRKAAPNAERLRLIAEWKKLGQELQARFEAAFKLSQIVNALGALRSEEAIPLVAPLLDSQGTTYYEDDVGFSPPQGMASGALERLKASGVEITGVTSVALGPVNWQDWWKREKMNYTRFRLGQR